MYPIEVENEKVVSLLLTGPHPIWHFLLSQLSNSLRIIYSSEYCNKHLTISFSLEIIYQMEFCHLGSSGNKKTQSYLASA